MRILVAKDEASIALLMRTMLSGDGHAVIGPVARVEGALELAERVLVDCARWT